MARERGTVNVDPFADLDKKIEILEREMAVQRVALDRLKEMGTAATKTPETPSQQVRRTA
jgi:hypothetical protein